MMRSFVAALLALPLTSGVCAADARPSGSLSHSRLPPAPSIRSVRSVTAEKKLKEWR